MTCRICGTTLTETPEAILSAGNVTVNFVGTPTCPKCSRPVTNTVVTNSVTSAATSTVTLAPTVPTAGTPVSRSWKTIAGFYAGAAFAAGLGIRAIADDSVFGAVVFVLVGALAIFFGGMTGWRAKCPRCGVLLVGIPAGYIGCATCAHYSTLVSATKLLTLLPDDAVVTNRFALKLKDVAGRVPGLCCGCGARATRTKHIASKQNGVYIELPHCDSCEGKKAAFGSGALFGPDADEGTFDSLNVSSYRFYQATLAMRGHKYFSG